MVAQNSPPQRIQQNNLPLNHADINRPPGPVPSQTNLTSVPIALPITDHYVYNCAVVGSAGVGKTSLI